MRSQPVNQLEGQFDTVEKRARRVFFLAFVMVFAIMMSLRYLGERMPSQLRACEQKCARYGRLGELVYTYTAAQTGGRDRGPAECRCR